MKIDTVFYRKSLLPNLYKAKTNNIDIRNKSTLLAHFTENNLQEEKLWLCLASEIDLDKTANLVESMENLEDESIFAEIEVETVAKELGVELSGEKLNDLLWRAPIKVLSPEKVTDKDVKELIMRCTDYLKKFSNNAENIKLAINDFLDQVYFTDSDFKAKKINASVEELEEVVGAKHLYYKGQEDDLDKIEIDSNITDYHLNLARRELRQFI